MAKPEIVVILALAGIISADVYLYFDSNRVAPIAFPLPKTINQSGSQNLHLFTPVPAYLKIVSQAENDTTGRTVIFQSNRYQIYAKIGKKYLPGTKTISYVAGRFVSWESIPNSQDRYLKLINPLTGQRLPTCRIIFSPFNTSARRVVTQLELLSLNRFNQGAGLNKAITNLGNIDKLPANKLNYLIQPGDILIVYPYYASKNKLYTDNQNAFYASAIVIRRWQNLTLSQK